jgi:hypothetical protein
VTCLNDRELAIWAAGFFDGEGCVSIVRTCVTARHPGYHGLYVVVANGRRDVLDLFCTRWDGRVNVDHPATQRWRAGFTWRVYGATAAQFLADIAPFVLVKREAVAIGLKLQTTVRVGRGHLTAEVLQERERMRLDLQALNGLQPGRPRKHFVEASKGYVMSLLGD